ncbi:hypothetical protein E4U54_004933 [Claviceps lovelessii]|nr:hypothetical protein E4U54_004933 [Claviceps lovelessii]
MSLTISLFGLAYAFVVAATPPDLTILCNQVPEICTNICWALRCANPSFSQFPTFDFPDRTVLRHRREAACGRRDKCSAGSDDESDDESDEHEHENRQHAAAGFRGPPYTACNEYPFASTTDAGNGLVTRCVPPSEQQYLQSRVSALQRRWKDAGKTSFYLGFGNPGGVRYCSNDACSNDGFEMQLPQPGAAARAAQVGEPDADADADGDGDGNAGLLFRYYRTRAGSVLASMRDVQMQSNLTREVAPGEILDGSFDTWTEEADGEGEDGEVRFVLDTVVQELPWHYFRSGSEKGGRQ